MTDMQITKLIEKLNELIKGTNQIIQEQKNQRTDIQQMKTRLEALELNSKQRYEVINARVNGVAKLIKEK